ncbi:MAG: hypothetical protein V1769_00075 [Thermoplasmatota archaeon]
MPTCPDCGGIMISDKPREVKHKKGNRWYTKMMVPLDCIECGSGVYVPYEGEPHKKTVEVKE